MKRRDKLVLANLGIVDKIAGGYARRVPAMLFDDLRQAGMMGLLDAATRFDASRGAPFAAFAIIRVRGAVLDAIRASAKHSRVQQLSSSNSMNATTRDVDARGGAYWDRQVSDCGAAAAVIVAGAESAEQLARIAGVVDAGSSRERSVMVLYYGKGDNMQVVASKMGLSPTRVFQLRAAALAAVRELVRTA